MHYSCVIIRHSTCNGSVIDGRSENDDNLVKKAHLFDNNHQLPNQDDPYSLDIYHYPMTFIFSNEALKWQIDVAYRYLIGKFKG